MNRLFAAALLLVIAGAGPASAAPPAKPNFIVILADDIGYECLGANGCESYETPHLDRLAASGMRFEHAYAQPLCTPTRLQLMTGRYNVRNYTSFGELDRKETTFAHLLKPAGYATGVFGKWQLGREVDSPQHFGFDVSCLWQQTRRPSRYPNPGLEFNGDERDFTSGEYGPDVVQNDALKFIDDHSDRPFFLYYPMILVHSPFVPTPADAEYDPKATNENAGQNKRFFASMVRHMDLHIGQLVAKLEERGLRDNTLILFVGDNGTGKGITTRWRGQDYPGGKGLSTRTGMHVPCIASWPGVIKPASVHTELVDTTDFLPTLLEAAGVSISDPARFDGHSLLAELKGEPGTPRQTMYSWHPSRAREFAATKSYKLYADGRFVEYASDPLAELELAAPTPETEAARVRLQQVLDRYSTARPAELKAKDGKGYQDNAGFPPEPRRARKKAA